MRIRKPSDIPQSLVDECAMGITPPIDVAARHDIVGEEWTELSKWEPFQRAVAAKQAEYEASGLTLRLKLRMMATHLFDNLFITASDPTTPVSQRLAVAESLAKYGELQPQQNAAKEAGTPFVVNINLAKPEAKVVKLEKAKKPEPKLINGDFTVDFDSIDVDLDGLEL